MANSFFLSKQVVISPPNLNITPSLRTTTHGALPREVNLQQQLDIGRSGHYSHGVVVLSLQRQRPSRVMPSVRIRPRATTGDDDEAAGDDDEAAGDGDEALLFWYNAVWRDRLEFFNYDVVRLDLQKTLSKNSFLRNKIILMATWLSTLSHVSNDPDLSDEANKGRAIKIIEFRMHEDEMAMKLDILPIANLKFRWGMDYIHDDISTVFKKYQYECTDKKLRDMMLATTLRNFMEHTLYPQMKELGTVVFEMADKRSHHQFEIELTECLTDFGGRFTYIGECAVNLPIFADFSVERMDFVNALQIKCHTKLGAYEYFCKIMSTIREFDSLLLHFGNELEIFILDGYIKISKDDKAIMSANMIDFKYCRTCIMKTENYFKQIESIMVNHEGRLEYLYEENGLYDLFSYCLMGYKKAVQWLKMLI